MRSAACGHSFFYLEFIGVNRGGRSGRYNSKYIKYGDVTVIVTEINTENKHKKSTKKRKKLLPF